MKKGKIVATVILSVVFGTMFTGFILAAFWKMPQLAKLEGNLRYMPFISAWIAFISIFIIVLTAKEKEAK